MKQMYAGITLKFGLLMTVALAAANLIPYYGHFAFPDILTKYPLPFLLRVLANFDGIHYVKIASEGYYTNGWAFFPLHPLLIRIFTPFFLGHFTLAALFVSNTAFLIGVYFLYKLLAILKISRLWFFLLYLSYPAAFFFHTAYSESLFFMLAVMMLYYLKTGQRGPASAAALMAAGTRVVGFLLAIPLFMAAWNSKDRRLVHLLTAVLFPLAGLGAYLLYQWRFTGDPLAFIHAQAQFNVGRSLDLVTLPQVYFRYAKILLGLQSSVPYFIAAVEVTLFTLVLATAALDTYRRFQKKDTFLLSIGIFSLASLLLPTFTGTLLSTPRFGLIALSSFFYLASVKNPAIKMGVAMIFAVFQVVLFALFARGYFVS